MTLPLQPDVRAIWDRCPEALLELFRAQVNSTVPDPWQTAVEIEEFSRLGMSKTDLRLLRDHGYLLDQRELQDEGSVRKFRPASKWNRNTCFVLSQRGLDFARQHLTCLPRGLLKPAWNEQARELCVAEELIKRYRCRASNQERILAVFQEENWPIRIDDPLPPEPNLDAKQRLRETVKSLNQNHFTRDRLRFHCDGNGQGIQWELAARSPTSPPV